LSDHSYVLTAHTVIHHIPRCPWTHSRKNLKLICSAASASEDFQSKSNLFKLVSFSEEHKYK